ncbi:MAG TPA: response regulator transcription factor [Halanaerobiales bacterium]|nr:response regulator transcription factor [Halanaerobiales bacterium]
METEKKQILILEDNPQIRKVISAYLERDGFGVRETDDGKEALEVIREEPPDLLILDLMLPGISGEQVCQQVRQFSDIPILMLTAKSKAENRINGLESGADDYLTKPFNPREMVARVRAVLRRYGDRKRSSELIILGEDRIKIYPGAMEVEVKGEKINLTSTEFKLLYTLLQHSSQVLSREQLADQAFGYEFQGFDRTIDVHIKNLRQKLGLKKGEYIITVYGQGYKFAGDSFEQNQD